MKKIDGMPVVDAAAPVRLKITDADIASGARKNPNACAVAVAACKRIRGVTAAKAHLGCIYLMLNGKWRRYYASGPIRVEMIAFDRGGDFYPGQYDLLPVPTGKVVKRQAARSAAHRSPVKRGPRRPRRKPYFVPGVRETAHRNEPAE
jgi:hypothetical protein